MYAFIDAHRETYGVEPICRVPGRLPCIAGRPAQDRAVQLLRAPGLPNRFSAALGPCAARQRSSATGPRGSGQPRAAPRARASASRHESDAPPALDLELTDEKWESVQRGTS